MSQPTQYMFVSAPPDKRPFSPHTHVNVTGHLRLLTFISSEDFVAESWSHSLPKSLRQFPPDASLWA